MLSAPAARRLKRKKLVGLPQNKNFCSSVFLSVSDVFRWKNYDEKNLKKIKNYYKKILWVLSNWWQHTPLYDSILMTILYLYVWWSFLLSVLLKQNPRIHIWIFQNETTIIGKSKMTNFYLDLIYYYYNSYYYYAIL